MKTVAMWFRPVRWGAALLGLAVLTSMLYTTRAESVSASADQLDLVIQPILSEEKTRRAYRPLAEYLSRATGRQVVIRTMPNFLAYWTSIRRPNSFSFVLDAAHFTDYRVNKLGYEVLAKIPDTVSYSLIVPEDVLVFEPSELIGKRIATLGSPSIGAARLAAMFPNPMRQPIIVEVGSSEKGMQMLLQGKVHAAILPTPLVFRQMSGAGGISVVMTTEPIPHIALSASGSVDPELRKAVRKALIEADKTPEGRAMLKKIGFPKFDPANAGIYAGQSDMLKKYWGY